MPTWGGGVSASILFRGEGGVIRKGCSKEKSPDFRSSEVGISDIVVCSSIKNNARTKDFLEGTSIP